MAHVTGNREVRERAAELLAAVLEQPTGLVADFGGEGERTEPEEEWELLTAVVSSLRERSERGDVRQPAAEIRLLRHLAARP
jgi:hypothetical protein